MPMTYWDFKKSGRENAEHYIAMCNEEEKAPKFPFLLGTRKNAETGKMEYYLPEGAEYDGYFKLLIDFKMYDNNGVGAPQNPVMPIFNTEDCEKMLKAYTGGHDSFPVAQNIVDEFVEKISKRSEPKFSLDIEVGTPSKERYNILKNLTLNVKSVNQSEVNENISEFELDRVAKSTVTVRKLKALAEKLGIVDTTYTKDSIEFEFTKGKIDESFHKQLSVNGVDNKNIRFAEMLSVLGDVIDNAILIERHSDRYSDKNRSDINLGRVHVLVSAFKNEQGIVPVKLVLKEFSDGRINKLHVAITLPTIKKVGIMGEEQNKSVATSTPTFFKVSLSEVLGIIKKDLSMI